MNPLNVGTLPACQRLQAAGIVLETEHKWYRYGTEWVSSSVWSGEHSDEAIPAPSMAEVWRELRLYTIIMETIDGILWAYLNGDTSNPVMKNTNPTDALIDLLIWVKQQKKGETK